MPSPKTVRSFRASGMSKAEPVPSQGVPANVDTTYPPAVDVGFKPDCQSHDLAAVTPIGANKLNLPTKPTQLGTVDLGPVNKKQSPKKES